MKSVGGPASSRSSMKTTAQFFAYFPTPLKVQPRLPPHLRGGVEHDEH